MTNHFLLKRRCWGVDDPLMKSGRIILGLALLALVGSPVLGQGIYRNGIGARSMSLGGTDVASADGPLESMVGNPAGLADLQGLGIDAGLVGGMASGEFSNGSNPGGRNLNESWMLGGEAAVAMPFRNSPIAIGLSVAPEAALEADWTYADTDPDGPGGTFVSYGEQRHRSEILVLRTALGLSWKISENLSLGASVGLIYNDNRLTAPYIFQTQPALAGLKTLLDLETDGFGVDGTIGLLWKPTDTLRVGLSYKSPSTVRSKGDANGDATAQAQEVFDPAPPFPPGAGAFHYDAEVVNHFPQKITAGAAWEPAEKWRLLGQVDWVNWSDAFDTLDVNLSNGSNATINTVVGSSLMEDRIALRWKDRFVFRGGVEYDLNEAWQLRGGYSYAKSPVRDAQLLPMLAAIMEHTLGVGIGWSHGIFRVSAAYQYSIPAEQRVGASGFRSGEYSNSRVEVSAHAVALTAGVRF